jgi:hypothetical protein
MTLVSDLQIMLRIMFRYQCDNPRVGVMVLIAGGRETFLSDRICLVCLPMEVTS